MARMKTFFIYLLIFVGFYILSNFLISAYIKTSYYKISSYDIDVQDATVVIISAKASKDDGHIEGKISNSTDEEITNKYMEVELFSDNNVSLGKEYIKIEGLYSGVIKDFKVDFTCDNVKHFKISFIDAAEKEAIENEKNQSLFKSNSQVDNIITQIEEGRKSYME
ncbi:MAG: hypothetical protein J6A89_06745 [Clostridia bacterium]|nr:hypothetical protein [Clostridia bacterium]